MTENNQEDEVRLKRALWLSLAILVVAGVVTAWLAFFRVEEKPVYDKSARVSPNARVRTLTMSDIETPKAAYREVAREIGVDWRHVTGSSGLKYFPESMGTGIAFVDWDNDDDPDLIWVNGTRWSNLPEKSGKGYLAAFENDGSGQFRDVTDELGLRLSLYGTGIATADYDGDGFIDLYLTALGKNVLLKNVGGQRFVDVTEEAGVAGDPFDYSTSVAFFDADGDADLDLVVGNYGRWTPEIHEKIKVEIPGVGPTFNEPDELEGQFGRLYENLGNGRFSERSSEWGIKVSDPATQKPIGKNLGFAFDYFNEDRILDFVVPNDRTRNLMMMSRPEGGFEDKALEMGLAYERRGRPSAAMGVDIDVDPTTSTRRIVMGNFFEEMTSVYVNVRGDLLYLDETVAQGIGPRTNKRVTFGVLFEDYDLDGHRDIFEVSGAIDKIPEGVIAGVTYDQPGDVFWYCGEKCKLPYRYVPPERAGDFANRIVGRGLASADIDGDGDIDFAASALDSPAFIYRLEGKPSAHWLRVKLKGLAPNTNAIGAEIFLRTGQHIQRRLVHSARSYLSATEMTQTFGLGTAAVVDELYVIWPNGERTDVEVDGVDKLIRVSQGSPLD